MGMFDDIYYGCATPLPLPDNAKDYVENNPDKIGRAHV